MIKVGQKVYFDPYDEIGGQGSRDLRGNFVTGTVVYVNYPHRWFTVAYGNPKLRTSFAFSDIGKEVKLSGRKQSPR